MPPGAWLVDLGPRLLPEQDLEALRTDAQASSPGGWVIQLADAATEEVYELLTGTDDELERHRLMDWHMPWHGAANCLEMGELRRRLLGLAPDLVLSLSGPVR